MLDAARRRGASGSSPGVVLPAPRDMGTVLSAARAGDASDHASCTPWAVLPAPRVMGAVLPAAHPGDASCITPLLLLVLLGR